MEDRTVLIQNAQTGDKRALEVLVEENSGLVHFIVQRFENRGYEREDLYQIGCLGLVKAIRKFDCEKGLQFSTYAVPVITGEIKRFLRDDGPVKISRGIQENRKKLFEAIEKLQKEDAKEPDLETLERETGLSGEEVILALGAGKEIESLNETFSGENNGEKLELLADSRNPYEEFLNKQLVAQLLESLEAGERQLIYLRYYQNLTQNQTAKLLHTSQVQISRREKKILENLRKMVQ